MNIDFHTDGITSWETFHDVSATTFGFPPYYGRNMDAWIDCMTYPDEAPGIGGRALRSDEFLVIRVIDAIHFRRQAPEQFTAMIDAVAFVNWRRIEMGLRPVVALAYRA